MSFLFDNLEFLKRCGFESQEDFDKYRASSDHFKHLLKIIYDWADCRAEAAIEEGRKQAIDLQNFVLERFNKEHIEEGEVVDVDRLDKIINKIMKLYCIEDMFLKAQAVHYELNAVRSKYSQAQQELKDLREILKSYRRLE